MGCGGSHSAAEPGLPDAFFDELILKRQLLHAMSVPFHERDDDTEIPGGLFQRLLDAAEDARTSSGQHVEVVVSDGRRIRKKLILARGLGPRLRVGCLVRVVALRPEAWRCHQFSQGVLYQQGLVTRQKEGELFQVAGLGPYWFHATELEAVPLGAHGRGFPDRRLELVRASPVQLKEDVDEGPWTPRAQGDAGSEAEEDPWTPRTMKPLQEHDGLSTPATEIASRTSSRASSASSPLDDYVVPEERMALRVHCQEI